jgi:hypothetical protein
VSKGFSDIIFIEALFLCPLSRVKKMRQASLNKSLALLILLLCAPVVAAVLKAQEPKPSAPDSVKATLFWESKGAQRWDLSEEPGVFLYSEQLGRQRPRDKVVYIAYGPLGEVAWYLLSIREWLRDRGGVREELIFTFDGGRENQLRYEAWLVPEGAAMPKVAGPPVEDEKATLEFTKYHYPNVCEYCPGQGRFVLRALAEALKQRPQRQAYLEFYGCGRSGRRSSVARREALKAKSFLIQQGARPSRLLVKIKENSTQRCQAQIRLLPSRLKSFTKQ